MLESGLVRNGKTAYVGAISDRSLDGKFRVSVVATGLEGSPLPASAPHAAEQIQTRTLQ
ncbi:cell division GTPase FtsZ [Rhizobium sp. BK226]|nr:cell division GTPase FtsZ [Rhizobium sp. BK112]MBB3366317.1 cell division GTPase FtsZ [Rhizobium sp. BK077]MBB3741294.1 cell division GTPase FtsZ [Rhizobium sp. BK591]MBB4110998.1 cell division GTPase FtsZ [Rhizobium sp. BK226]MBB4176995.1 cell division GTPase FtsZ [Rhizobium sp. BK109]MBB4250002.1 cell division GTPase FtsZ [Rhizobium sp. BK008]